MMNRSLVLLLLAVLGVSAVQVQAQDDSSAITIQGTAQFLSDLAVNPLDGTLLVSSRADGGIYSVAADGVLTPVLQSDALTSAGSLTVDAASNRIIVLSSGVGAMMSGGSFQLPEGIPIPEGGFPAGGFPGGNGQMPELPADFQLPEGFALPTSSLFAFDLASGQQTLNVELNNIAPTMGGLLGSVTIDASGSAYITDMLAGVVYRVDSQGAPTFLSDSQFTAQGAGISGILYHPDGFLLVAKSSDGTLFKIDLTTATVTPVTVMGGTTSISDLALLADGSVAALDPLSSSLVILTSGDGWAAAQASTTLTVPAGASAVAARGSTIYVLHISIDTSIQPDSGQIPPVTSTISVYNR